MELVKPKNLTLSLRDMTELQVRLPLFKHFLSDVCPPSSVTSLHNLAKTGLIYLKGDLEKQYVEKYSIENEIDRELKLILTQKVFSEDELEKVKAKVNEIYKLPKKTVEKYADLSIFDPDTGELRPVLIEIYNRRTQKICGDYLGMSLSDKDPHTGLLINPMMKNNEFMGMAYGRGWAKYGANLTVDIRLEIEDTNPPEVLVFPRPLEKDYGDKLGNKIMSYVLPGGLIDYKSLDETETPFEAVDRETKEETSVSLPESVRRKLLDSKPKSFISADARNSVHTFNVNTLFSVKISREESNEIKKQLQKTSETKGVPLFMSVVDATSSAVNNFGAHKVMIKGNA